MNTIIKSDTLIPVRGISRFTDNEGNSIKGLNLECKDGANYNLNIKESVEIHQSLSPWQSMDILLDNILSVSETDLGEMTSPLEKACNTKSSNIISQ